MASRNELLRKVTGSFWGAQPHTLRTTAMALALCLSTTEYASPVCRISTHLKQIDVTLHATGRLVTGCLRNSKVEEIYVPAIIAPPVIRRVVQAD